MNRFPNGARVCFVGDSITHNGLFMAKIAAYYREHFKDAGVEFYNCGISGGTLGNALRILKEEVLIYDPTHIVLMIGVNDSRRDLLSEPASEERYRLLLEAYETYGKNLEAFYQVTRERGIALILCTPVPYAEYQKEAEAPLCGAYALLLGYADFVRAFAKEKGLALCDYHTALTAALQTEELYRPDCVHPTERGHYRMAQTFLAFQGLSLAEDKPLPTEMAEWYATVQKLRNVVATEYFTVPDYTEMDRQARYAAVTARLGAVEEGKEEMRDYFVNLMRDYQTDALQRDEFVRAAKAFMKQK